MPASIKVVGLRLAGVAVLLLPLAAIALDMVRAGNDLVTCQNQCHMTVYGDGSIGITDSGNGWVETDFGYYDELRDSQTAS